MSVPVGHQTFAPPGRDRSLPVLNPVHSATDPSFVASQFAGMNINAMNMPPYSGPVPMGHAHPIMLGPDSQVMYGAMRHAQAVGANHGPDNMYHHYAMGPTGYATHNIGMPLSFLPLTPGRINAQFPLERSHADVPGLEGNRRGSYSTTESTPATPYYASHRRDVGPRVASAGRSSYTTPSPQQVDATPSKTTYLGITEEHLDELLQLEPAIPRAVPAVFTPANQTKTAEQSLENRIPGNRNVYIRGLHPTIDDDMLFAFASRFGKVETSKAIIDTSTGACKGFGFAKFEEVRDSEKCIRGFHRLGYEVGFARESFNSRLKAEGDEDSTNLYISNLPKTMSEMELETVFRGFNILSSKILRDSMGNSRGVGFARFESRDICDDVIRRFNNATVGDDRLLMNIRYADTPSQKELKRVTAERRQFRTNEYNIGAYGTTLVGVDPSIHGDKSQYQWPRNPGSVRRNSRYSAHEEDRVVSHSNSHRQSEPSSITDTYEVSTPASSESDEGVTIRPVSAGKDAALGSTQSSPIKKSMLRKDE